MGSSQRFLGSLFGGGGSVSSATVKPAVGDTVVRGQVPAGATAICKKNGTVLGAATVTAQGAASYTVSSPLVAGDQVSFPWALTGESPAAIASNTPVAPPVNTALPVISGTAQVGQTLVASVGVWSNSPTSYAYTFTAGGTLVQTGSVNAYAPKTGDIGKTIAVSVVATNAIGSAAATSAATSAVTAAPSIKGVVFKGDSLTAGYLGSGGSATSPAVFSSLTGVSSINQGIVGQYLDDMAAKYASADASTYNASTANTLVLEGGVNDIKGGKTLSQLQAAVQSYVSQARSTGFAPVMVKTITATNVSGWTSGMETIRTGYNSWLRANFASFADKLSDGAADARFSDPTNATYFNADMLHYTDAGYAAQGDIDRLALGLPLSSPATAYTVTAGAAPVVGAPTTVTIRASGGLNAPVTVNIAASPDGTLSASSVTLPARADASATITYTPATTGQKTLTTTNTGGLTNPAATSITAAAAVAVAPTFSTTVQSGPVALSNSNRTATLGSSGASNTSAGLSGSAITGKKFFAATLTTFTGGGYVAFGLTTQAVGANTAVGFGSSAGESGVGLYQGGGVYAAGGSLPGTFPAFAQGDTIGVLADGTNTMVWFTKDGVNFYGAGGTAYTAAQVAAGTGGIVVANVFGKGALGAVGTFSGAVGSAFTTTTWPSGWATPSGFSSL